MEDKSKSVIARSDTYWSYGSSGGMDEAPYLPALARLRHNFSVRAEDYEKVELYLPVEQLSPLEATCCPLESDVILQSALVVIRFYRELAQSLARTHDMKYPADLDRVMSERLEKLR